MTDTAPGTTAAGHRDPAAGPQGAGAHRVRPRLDESEPAARLPDRPRARPRLRDRGHRRQRVPRLRRRHRRQLDRSQPPRRRRRDPAPGRGALSTSPRATSTCRSTPRRPRSSRGSRRCAVPARAFIGNSGAEAVEAGIKLAQHHTKPPERDRVPRRVPRPDDGRREPDGVEGEVPRPLRPAAPRRLPRAVRQRGSRRARAARLQAPDAGRRVRRGHRGADPGRGRLRRPRGRLPAAASASCATATGSCSSPTRSSRAPGAPGRCGRSSTGTWSPTSCSPRRASGPGMPVGAMIARSRAHDLGPGRPRQHLRRQPGGARRAAGDGPAARGRAHRQRRDPRPRDPWTGSGRSSPATRTSSRTSAARA